MLNIWKKLFRKSSSSVSSTCENPKSTINEVDFSNGINDEENNYANFYVNETIRIHHQISLLLQKEPPDTTNEKVSALFEEMKNIECKTIDNEISLHYFYQNLIIELYKYRDTIPWAMTTCLCLCNLDIALLSHEHIKKRLRGFVVYCFARKAIYLEREGKIAEAIEVCDKAIEGDYLDTTRNLYSDRKTKLLKKLKNQNNGG